MRLWKRLLIVNVGVLAGCFAALYLVPPETPLRMFVLTCVGLIVLLNLAMFLDLRIRKAAKTPRTPTPASSFRSAALWIMTALILLTEILIRLGYVKF
jgi:hypothetical protein